MTALRPDVHDAVMRHAAQAYLHHLPSHFAIDLLNGLVAHLERSCRHVKLDATQTRQLLDAFLYNVLVDVQNGADADKHAHDAMVAAMRSMRKQDLPPAPRSSKPPGYMDPHHWRRVYEQDWPDGSVEG